MQCPLTDPVSFIKVRRLDPLPGRRVSRRPIRQICASGRKGPIFGGALPVSKTNPLLVLALALVVTVARAASPPAPYPLTFDPLLEDAKRRAAVPYTPQHNRLPAGLDKLSPEQYRSIRFNPDAGIWRAEQLPFRVELLRAGYNLQTSVTVSTVENGMAQDVVATPAMFEMESTLPAQLGK